MIPKIIHYCWFGRGEKPALAQRCIASWKKFCPDYEIIEWNEDNFDVNSTPYTKMCYESRKYAFLTDYVRLLVVERQGGIYFDTDVELVKAPDSLLEQKAYMGFETQNFVQTGLGFGSEPHGEMVQAMLAQYNDLLDGTKGTIGCPILNTKALEPFGLKKDGTMQKLSCGTIYPCDWFNPYDVPTGRLRKTENTVSIHWYSGSWMKKSTRLRMKLAKPLHRFRAWLKGL